MVTEKSCKNCEQALPATTKYFNKSKFGIAGLRGVCKVCTQMITLLQRLGIHFTVIGHRNEDKPTKICGTCKNEFPRTTKYFYGNSAAESTDKLQGVCISCTKQSTSTYSKSEAGVAYRRRTLEQARKRSKIYYENNKPAYFAASAKRRASEVQACPLWVDKTAIYKIYKNRPEGFHVDHIIPLNNPIVCGLHVSWNLQYLPAMENIQKSNKFIQEIN